jgi:hypothetical protein
MNIDLANQVLNKFVHAVITGRLRATLMKFKFNQKRLSKSKFEDYITDIRLLLLNEGLTNVVKYDLIYSLDYLSIMKIEKSLLLEGKYSFALKLHDIMISKMKILEKNHFTYSTYISFETFSKFGLYRAKKYNFLVHAYNKYIHGRFYDFVYKKRVAILGPIFEEDSINLEEYDTIIRINDVISSSTRNNFHYKTNITYLNSEILQKLISGLEGFRLNETSEMLYVIKNYNVGSTKYLKNKPYRLSYSNPYFLNGSPNMVQMVVWDLLHFEPSEIMVMGVDFFISKNKYSKNYVYNKDKFKISFQDFIKSQSIHNLISNRRFMITLSKLGLVKFDENANRVLTMSDEEYLRKIYQ